MTIKTARTFFALILVFGIAVPAWAEDGTGERTVVKEMVGEVVYFTPKADPQVIYVGHDGTNTDYSFFVDKDTIVQHVKKLTDLKQGDTVRVKYLEITKMEKKAGSQYKAETRIARVISFVRAGEKKARPQAESGEDEEGASKTLVSD